MLQHGHGTHKDKAITYPHRRPLSEYDGDEKHDSAIVCENSPSLHSLADIDEVSVLKTENERLTRQLADSKRHINELHGLDHEYDAVITDLEQQLLALNDELQNKEIIIQTLTDCDNINGHTNAHAANDAATVKQLRLQSELNGFYEKEKKWKTEREQLEMEIFELRQKSNAKATKNVQLTNSTELLSDTSCTLNLSDDYTEQKWQMRSHHSNSPLNSRQQKKTEEKKKKFSLFGWSMC